MQLLRKIGAPASRRLFMPPGKCAVDFNHYLAKDCIALWLAAGGKMKDFRPTSSAVSHDSIYQNSTSLTSPAGSDIGVVMNCTPTNANAFATSGYSQIAGVDAVSFNITTASVEAWFWLRQLPQNANDNPGLIARTEAASNQNGINVFCYYNSAGSAAIGGLVRNATTTTDCNPGAVALLKQNYWHHVVFSFASAGTLNLWLDGRLIATAGPAVTWTYNGQAIYFGAHSQIAGTYFNGWNGMIGKIAWYSRQLNDQDAWTLSRSPMAMLKASESPFFNGGFIDPGLIVNVDYADTLSWSSVQAKDPELSNAVVWTDAYIAGDITTAIDASISNALTWTMDQREDQTLSNTLIWSGDETSTFTLPDNYATDGDLLLWSDRFTSDVGELANARYRR